MRPHVVLALLLLGSAARAEPLTNESDASDSGSASEQRNEPALAKATAKLDELQRDDVELEDRVQRLESTVGRLTAGSSGSQAYTTPKTETSALQPTILSEADYRVYPSKAEGNTGFALARLRPGLVLSPVPWFRALTTIEFAGENPVILDAFMRLRASEAVEFTLGYSKPPLFASFIYEPAHTLPFPDRSPLVTSFRVRRDLGADVHFTPSQLPIEAWARIGNGTGSPLGNDNALPAFYGALNFVNGRAARHSSPKGEPFGLRLGVGGLLEKASDRDGISGQTPLGFVYFRPIVVSGVRRIAEAHAIVYAGATRLTLEAAAANEARSRDDDGNPSTPRVDLPNLHSYGMNLELAWVVLGIPREVGTAPKEMRRSNEAWSGGAVELAARYDALWLGRGASDVDSGGSQGGALAVKWWPLNFLATNLTGYVTHFDVAPIEEPHERWSWGAILRSSFFWGLPG